MYIDLEAIILLLLLARFLGILVERAGFNALIGEIIAGCLFGFFLPTIFVGNSALVVFSDFGILTLMFLSGLTTNFELFREFRTESIVVGSSGVVFTFTIMLFSIYALNTMVMGMDKMYAFYSALFIATILSNTAIEVSAAVFVREKENENVKTIVIGAGFVDDILAVFMIGLVSSIVLYGGTPSMNNVFILILKVALFLILSFLVLSPLVSKIFDLISAKMRRKEETLLTASIILMFAIAAFARQLGLHEVIGAYLAGLFVGKWGGKVDPMLRRSIAREKIVLSLDPTLRSIFSPMFFGFVGIIFSGVIHGLDLRLGLLLIPLILSLAIIGKILGCGLGAYILGMGGKDALLIGVGMCGRGALELVLLKYGMDAGVITNAHFASLVIITMLTVLFTPLAYSTIRERLK